MPKMAEGQMVLGQFSGNFTKRKRNSRREIRFSEAAAGNGENDVAGSGVVDEVVEGCGRGAAGVGIDEEAVVSGGKRWSASW